ncbi:MAG: GNAT family N-acetyltransferase, partial [Halobacteriota archaeon]
DLRLYAAFNGQQPVGFIPVFVRETPIGSIVTSPPPGFNVPRLGPIVTSQSPKRRKRESIRREFVSALVSELRLQHPTRLARFECAPSFADPRSFSWEGFDVGVSFTYRIDVRETTPETLLSRASKSLRREISSGRQLDVSIDREGLDGARRIHEATADRYREQGRSYPLSWAYVGDLLEALGPRARSYVVRDPDGAYLTGVNVLYSNDSAYFWQGGTRATYDGVAVNSMLHWRILEDVASEPPIETVCGYDLFGADTERLCRYKSKFPAELIPYYVVETGGTALSIAKRGYKALR